MYLGKSGLRIVLSIIRKFNLVYGCICYSASSLTLAAPTHAHTNYWSCTLKGCSNFHYVWVFPPNLNHTVSKTSTALQDNVLNQVGSNLPGQMNNSAIQFDRWKETRSQLTLYLFCKWNRTIFFLHLVFLYNVILLSVWSGRMLSPSFSGYLRVHAKTASLRSD